jgi:hypothetical protein
MKTHVPSSHTKLETVGLQQSSCSSDEAGGFGGNDKAIDIFVITRMRTILALNKKVTGKVFFGT